ncbi:MAG: hypothetical protein ACK4YV_06625 [Emticicia sp.]
MKKITISMLIIIIGACIKEDVNKNLDLNSTFSGKVTGKLDPYYFDGTSTWVITHQDSIITVEIDYLNVSANGPGVPKPVTDFEKQIKLFRKYKAKIINDTTFVGGFTDIPANSYVNGQISKDGTKITCATTGNDPTVNYVRFSYDLTRK